MEISPVIRVLSDSLLEMTTSLFFPIFATLTLAVTGDRYWTSMETVCQGLLYIMQYKYMHFCDAL